MNQNKKIDKPHVRIATIGHVDHSKAELKKIIEKILNKQLEVNSALQNEKIVKTYEEENAITLRKSYKNLK